MKRIIYAITRHACDRMPALRDVTGIGKANLYSICYQEAAAVVSNIEAADSLSDPVAVIEYAAAVEQLAQHVAVLPVKFGTCRQSETEVQDILQRNYVEFMNNLHEVSGKEEYGLKIFLDVESSMRRMIRDNELTGTFSGCEVPQSVPQRRYVFEKLKQQRAEDALKIFAENFNREINYHLAVLQPIQRVMECKAEGVLLDTVFLVDRAKRDQFIQIMNHLNDITPDLDFLLTGPWPPYHFVGPLNMLK